MSEKTGIAWCDHTFNIAWGCTKVDSGCTNCYADRDATRYGFKIWGKDAERRTFGEKHWREPLRWNEAWKRDGIQRRVFTSSMCDVFEDHPTIDAERAKLWPLIEATPNLTWQILTKRGDRMIELLPELPNVWAIVSVSDQESADLRIPQVLRVKAPVRGVSYEPAVGPVDFTPWVRGSRTLHVSASIEGMLRNRSFDALQADDGRPLSRSEAESQLRELHAQGVKLVPSERCDAFDPTNGCSGHRNPRLDWVIVGGESGPKARPFDVAWARSTVAQCKAAGVAVFVKQLGARPVEMRDPGPPFCEAPHNFKLSDRKGGDPEEWPEDLRVREFPS